MKRFPVYRIIPDIGSSVLPITEEGVNLAIKGFMRAITDMHERTLPKEFSE